jgi:hypothetical protein
LGWEVFRQRGLITARILASLQILSSGFLAYLGPIFWPIWRDTICWGTLGPLKVKQSCHCTHLAKIAGMKSTSKPRLPIEIYIFGQNFSSRSRVGPNEVMDIARERHAKGGGSGAPRGISHDRRHPDEDKDLSFLKLWFKKLNMKYIPRLIEPQLLWAVARGKTLGLVLAFVYVRFSYLWKMIR